MVGNSLALFLKAAGANQLLQGLAIILGTFVLEDAATILAAMQEDEGGIPIWLALISLYAGAVLGDLALHGLGRLSARIGWIAAFIPPDRSRALGAWLRPRVFKVVLVSRFLPGTRFPAYTVCGFLRADLRQFTLAAIVATLVWTTLLFGLSLRVGQFLIDHFGARRWVGAAGLAIALIGAGRAAARLQDVPR